MRTPKRFVSIHNHCTFSAHDGLGYPDDHFKWCIENGLDAHAITDHGNMNCYAHAQLWVEDYNKKNDVKFKYIPGVEGYFHPDLSQWEKDKELHESSKSDRRIAKKLKDKQEVQTKLIIKSDTDEDIEDIEMANQLTIEDEDATKSNKHFNPINRRHHLVVLPKNSAGLIEIFGLISKSYLKNFYRFPRFDAKDLANVAKNGNIITSSACIGGQIAWSIFQLLQGIDFDKLDQGLLNDNALLDRCVNAVGNYFELLENTTGKGNNFLELQFNKLPAQNLVNRAILEFVKRNGLNNKLVVTCDAHYYNPDVWKERELYKKLGFMNYKEIDSTSLPKSKDDLKCELYPKNATQLWETYLQVKNNTNFYDDEVICDAIERTHDIAHNLIEEVKPDRSPKFPTKLLVPEDITSFKHLVKLCKEGLIKRGLDGKQAYVDRLKEELGVIKQLNNADYFITYQKIVDLARGVGLVGVVRGSGGGSLMNYVLYITDLDPIEWNLPFERFISIYRKGSPDIDTDVSDRDKVLNELRKFFGFENVVPISNYNTFKVKTLLKDIGKFYGISFDETNAATLTVDQDVRKATTVQGEDKNLFVLTYDGAMEHSPSFRSFIEKYPNVGESMKILFKQNRALSRHAGGTVICDDLPNKAPLIVSGGEPQFPFVEGVNYKHCEYIGNYIKQDILGLATLRLIERTIELILKDKLYEICIENKKYRFPFNTKIKLEDGTCVEVQNLDYNHNVKVPIEIEK